MNRFHRLPDNLKGIAFLMLASLALALMALLIKLLGQRLHITQILLVRQIGMIIMVAPAILRNFPGSLRTTRLGMQLIRVFCALVAMVSYFGQKCNIFAYKHGEASLLASLDYVRLLWATLFGFLVFDQLPGAPTWLGAAVVVAAAIFTIYRETRRKHGWISAASANDGD